MNERLSATVSVAMKVNLGNYESADLFLSVSNVTIETTEEEIEDVLDAGHIAYKAIRTRMKARMEEIKPQPKPRQLAAVAPVPTRQADAQERKG